MPKRLFLITPRLQLRNSCMVDQTREQAVKPNTSIAKATPTRRRHSADMAPVIMCTCPLELATVFDHKSPLSIVSCDSFGLRTLCSGLSSIQRRM